MSEIGTDCLVPFVRDVEEGRREERKRKEGRQEGRSGGQFVCVCVCVCVPNDVHLLWSPQKYEKLR